MDETVATLSRYAFGIWRRRWIALGMAWLICLVGWLAVVKLPPTYEADAEVAVAPGSVLAPFLHGIAIGDNTGTGAALLLEQTLISRPVLTSLIAQEKLLDASATPTARAVLEANLAKAIRISPETSPGDNQQLGNLFTISYRDRSPDRAYRVVKGMLDIFVDRTVGSHKTDLANAQHFLDDQIASYGRRLQEVQQRRAAFVSKYSKLLPGENRAPSQYDLARTNVESLETRLQNAASEIALLRREVATTPATVAVGTNAANAQALAAAEQKLADLQQRFTDAYPGVIAARKLVADLASGKGLAALPGEAAPNPFYDQLKLQLLDAETKEITIRRELQTATAERDRMAAVADANPNLNAEYADLNGEYDMVRSQYNELLSRRASTRLTAAANAHASPIRLNVVNPPQRPLIPVAPRRKLLLAGVLAVGLGAGIGVAFLLAYTDSCCYTVRELEGIGLPVIGGISLRRAPARRRKALPALGFGAALCLLVVAFAGVVVVAGHLGWRA